MIPGGLLLGRATLRRMAAMLSRLGLSLRDSLSDMQLANGEAISRQLRGAATALQQATPPPARQSKAVRLAAARTVVVEPSGFLPAPRGATISTVI